jgi:hypothetical protein
VVEGRLECLQGGHERFGDVLPPERPKVSVGVGNGRAWHG